VPPDNPGNSFGKPIERNAMCVATPFAIIALPCSTSHQRGPDGLKRSIDTPPASPTIENIANRLIE